MGFEVREFRDEDYPGIAEVFRDDEPERPFSAEFLREWDRSMPSHVLRVRWVAVKDGRIVGTAILTHHHLFFQPNQYVMNVWVIQEARGSGIGGALYDAANARVGELKVERLETSVMEDRPGDVRFADMRGFCEEHCKFQSLLDSSEFRWDESRVANMASERGIRILTLPELASDPEHRRRIFELQERIDDDIPGVESRPKITFETFWYWIEKDIPKLDSFFVAVHSGEYVGLHFGFGSKAGDRFNIALTGVLPSHRGIGLATVLRSHGMRFAQQGGYRRISTWNDSRNAPILAMNHRDGFKREPAAICMIRAPL